MIAEPTALYVNSKDILRSCNVRPEAVSSARSIAATNWAALQSGTSVYVHGSALRTFARLALPLIRAPILLVSGDCDQSSHDLFIDETHLRALLDRPSIGHWMCQNLTRKHPKATQIPIGLDYHTLAASDGAWGPQSSPMEQERDLRTIAANAPPFRDRKPIAYCNFQFHLDRHGDRLSALQWTERNARYLEPNAVSRKETWMRQSEYAFVISPHGNGVDCHRTWEALALGCVPIVRTSPLDALYEGLPVLIVSNWCEVTADFLRRHIDNPPEATQPEKLTLAYWLGRLQGIAGKLKEVA
jgi:hypothetical protein